MEIAYRSDAPEGTLLGHFTIGGENGPELPLVSGLPFRADYEHRENLLFSLGFTFSRNAALEIGAVTLRRAE